MAKTTLSLSTGATREASPSWIARKWHNHESPVASPESVRKIQVRGDSPASSAGLEVTAAMLPLNTRITAVRTAVARSGETPVTPTFARMAVSPAKSAESKARYCQFILRPYAAIRV